MLPNPDKSLLGLELGSLWVCLVGGPSLLGVDLRSWMLVGAAAYTQTQDAQRCFDGHGAPPEGAFQCRCLHISIRPLKSLKGDILRVSRSLFFLRLLKCVALNALDNLPVQ